MRYLVIGEKLFLAFLDNGAAEADDPLGMCRIGLLLELGQNSLQVGAKDGEEDGSVSALSKICIEDLHLWIRNWT